MQTIYHYSDEFNREDIINKMNEISEQIHEEETKNNEEYNKQKVKELLYAQFIQGLRLNYQ